MVRVGVGVGVGVRVEEKERRAIQHKRREEKTKIPSGWKRAKPTRADTSA
jgi:hypothetical protein